MNRRRFLQALAATPVAVALSRFVGRPTETFSVGPIRSGVALAALNAPTVRFTDAWINARINEAMESYWPADGFVALPDGEIVRYHVVDEMPFVT